MISKLIAALRNLQFEPTDEDVADMLWLALQIGPSGPPEEIKPLESDVEKPPQGDKPLLKDDAVLQAQQLASINPPQTTSTPKPASSNLYLTSYQGRQGKRISSGTLPFRSPGTTALPGTLDLGRALRSFMRRVPSRSRFTLDEEETAEYIAEQGIWMPILNPAPEHWLEVALVVDESRSMDIWRQTIAELQLLLERHGAFRDVRTWGLVTYADGRNVRVRPGIDITAKKRPTRDPNELIDPRGRRLILVASDCVSRAWHKGTISEVLANWGRSGPVAIVQLLPRRLWTRSALGDAVKVRLRSSSPGLPNMRLDYDLSSYWIDKEDLKGWLPIPIVTLEPRSLAEWARAITGVGNAWTEGYALNAQKTEESMSGGKVKQNQEAAPPLSAEERLKRFRATASPMARTLTGLLSAAPISLPVVRLIQQTMLPASNQGHVAEIFLGGLLEQLSKEGEVIDPYYIEYDFVNGIRELLLNSMPMSEAIQVLKEVSAFVERRLGQFLDFRVLLEDPTSAEGIGISTDDPRSRPFASVAAKVLRRLGGKYASLAERIEKMSSEPQEQLTQPSAEVSPMANVGKTPEMLPESSNKIETSIEQVPSFSASLTTAQQKLAAYQEALHILTPEAAPLEYAITQHNLGNAYRDLPTGDRASNLAQAIRCYQEALRFLTPEAAPLDYARTQINLGNAYRDLPTGDRVSNLF